MRIHDRTAYGRIDDPHVETLHESDQLSEVGNRAHRIRACVDRYREEIPRAANGTRPPDQVRVDSLGLLGVPMPELRPTRRTVQEIRIAAPGFEHLLQRVVHGAHCGLKAQPGAVCDGRQGQESGESETVQQGVIRSWSGNRPQQLPIEEIERRLEGGDPILM